MANSINLEHLTLEIQKHIKEYNDNVKNDVFDIAMNVSEKAVKKLREESPNRTGQYAKHWAKTKNKDGVVIYNKNPTYRLTHLLEKGHQLKRGGRKVGKASAHPHIEKIEKECVDEYVAEVERRL